jgi:hypothetical protein
MRNDNGDIAEGVFRHLTAGSEVRPAARRAGATVSIPPRPGPSAPFGPATLHARLASLRPQPVRLLPRLRSEA